MSEPRRISRRRRPIAREVLSPRGLVRYGHRTLRAATPLVLLGPPGVLVAYGVTFVLTPTSGVTGEFYAAASQIIPVLLLVLAIEAQAFRLRTSGVPSPRAFLEDARVARDDDADAAVDAVVDAAVETADALARRLTAVLLLVAMLAGEVVALVPLLTGDAGSASPRPVMAAIVAGLCGVAYVAITGSSFLRSDAAVDDEDD